MDNSWQTNNILSRIHYLTQELPHRGSTTLQEKKAANYACDQFKSYGYSPSVDEFYSATSAYYPALLFGAFSLVSVITYILFPSTLIGVTSITVITISLVSILTDASFGDNLFSFVLPKKPSQNIVAILKANQKVKNNLVIMAHIDSHRTPLLFSSPFWVKVLKLLIPTGVGLSMFTIALIIISVFLPSWFFVTKILLLLISLFFGGLVVLMAQADLTPYTTGANDNASGVATLLQLSQELKHKPLLHTSIYFVVSGCEEVGSYGSRAFIKKYQQTIGNCFWFTIDGVSATMAQPAILLSEKFYKEIKSDPVLIKIASTVINKNPKLDAFLLPQFQGAYTDSSPAGLNNFRTISLLALRKNGTLPAWHTVSDNFKSVDKVTLSNCYLFSKKLIQEYRKTIG